MLGEKGGDKTSKYGCFPTFLLSLTDKGSWGLSYLVSVWFEVSLRMRGLYNECENADVDF